MATIAGALIFPGIGATSSAAASAEEAGSLPPKYAEFAHCPIDNPKVTACVYSVLTSGTFKGGNASLNITQPEYVNLGLIPQRNGTEKGVAPTDGTPVLQGQPIPVTILGLPGLPSPLNVTATENLVSLPDVNVTNLEIAQGTGLSLPLYVSINSTLIGPGCSIGNSSNPIVINLTTGTTDPPPPNSPIKGSVGDLKIDRHGVVTDTGMQLVDNAFAVPGAYGCGLLGVLDEPLDLIEGLPSAAGNNTGIFNANTDFAPASLIRQYLK